MAWVPVHAGQDHLLQFTKQNPIEALAELIWNGLDAEADTVDVSLEVSSVLDGLREFLHVSRVTVTDNGHGITPDKAASAFPSLGDSWKKSLNGRTLNGKRALHGSRGRGRFYAYSLGARSHWSSVAQTADGLRRIEIEGTRSRIDGFAIEEPQEASGPTGTTVTIAVEQGRSLSALARDDAPMMLAARLGAHLLGNPDIAVRVNGRPVDPRPLVDGEPTDMTLDQLPLDALEGREIPILTVVDWTDLMRSPPGIVLCNEHGASLCEVDKTSPPGTVRSTGYLKWSGWAAEGAADLVVAGIRHPAILDVAVATLAEHVAARTGVVTATIVATLKEEGAYPYPEIIDDPVQNTERQLFDLLAVTARTVLRQGGRQHRAMTARLLQLALQERPEELDFIIGKALSLTKVEREELAELLRFSSLGSIFAAAAEVTRRLDLLAALRHFVYSPDVSDDMREVDQLHPLVKDHVWLFGESWQLSRSEAGLTNILRAAVGKDVALETDLLREGERVFLPDGKRGRVDLLLQRTLVGTGDRQDRLVIELKRPSVRVGDKELTQVRKYARALSEHAGAGPSRWTFWLVAADTHPTIASDLEQDDREWGHIGKATKYDIWVTTWGRLIDQAERRFKFYRDQLAYSASQEQAVEHIRRRHEELLPPEPSHESETTGKSKPPRNKRQRLETGL